MYEEVPSDPSVLVNTIIKALEKICLRGDFSSDTLHYFFVENPKFARFYLLPKVHKHLHNVPVRPVILNGGFYTENIFLFLNYHLQRLGQKVKSYIKNSFKFLETRYNKQISSDTLTELVEVVLKNKISEFGEKIFKQKRGTAIGSKFAPPYAILFGADFEEKMLENF